VHDLADGRRGGGGGVQARRGLERHADDDAVARALRGTGTGVCSLARCRPGDIEASAKALEQVSESVSLPEAPEDLARPASPPRLTVIPEETAPSS
jgi:hypothetical protein